MQKSVDNNMNKKNKKKKEEEIELPSKKTQVSSALLVHLMLAHVFVVNPLNASNERIVARPFLCSHTVSHHHLHWTGEGCEHHQQGLCHHYRG